MCAARVVQTGGVLPDSVRSGLHVLFVGTAAGAQSAARGAYYAHPANRFWRTLADVGLTERLYRPEEFGALLARGIGFTDLAKHVAGMDHVIRRDDYDLDGFADRVMALRPAIVAFTSKRAASVAFRLPTGSLAYGCQKTGIAGADRTFVLPSPSGAATRYWSPEPWRELARAVTLP